MKKVFGNSWVVSAIVAVVVALILALGLPLVVGFLRPTWVRVTCVLLVAAVWGLLAFLRVRKARKAADAIAAELAQPSAADEESKALAARMGEAMATLRSAANKKRDYLYTKPWYVIIGPPGAGKTTALAQFRPALPDRRSGAEGRRRHAQPGLLVRRRGGNGRHRRPLHDAGFRPGGRFARVDQLSYPPEEEPSAAADQRHHRRDRRRRAHQGRLRPKIDDHARAVRRRMVELRRTLEVAAPVYVMLTKADLLAGFTEYYDDLDVEGRRAVLGATIPLERGQTVR